MKNKIIMSKLLSCYVEGSSDVLIFNKTQFLVKSITDYQVEHVAEHVLYRSFSFLESYQILNLYKIHMLCQAEIRYDSNETFQCSDTWYFRGGIAP